MKLYSLCRAQIFRRRAMTFNLVCAILCCIVVSVPAGASVDAWEGMQQSDLYYLVQVGYPFLVGMISRCVFLRIIHRNESDYTILGVMGYYHPGKKKYDTFLGYLRAELDEEGVRSRMAVSYVDYYVEELGHEAVYQDGKGCGIMKITSLPTGYPYDIKNTCEMWATDDAAAELNPESPCMIKYEQLGCTPNEKPYKRSCEVPPRTLTCDNNDPSLCMCPIGSEMEEKWLHTYSRP
ncbi:uncharacterized protein LOC135393401 [Ornithodoros turicata]|uniref:uncharacterized protein LOC135393401 n=1 Tax=Ornithodoros turicata TaxID=34597 RepID=UPI00313998D6